MKWSVHKCPTQVGPLFITNRNSELFAQLTAECFEALCETVMACNELRGERSTVHERGVVFALRVCTSLITKGIKGKEV